MSTAAVMHQAPIPTRARATRRIAPSGNVRALRIPDRPAKSDSRQKKPSFNIASFLGLVREETTTRTYRDKQVIFTQGDPADAVFYIESGEVKLTVVSKRGKEAVIAILEKGNFFGEGSLAGQSFRVSSANAIQRTSLIRIKKDVMTELLHFETEYAEYFMKYLLSRNIRIEEDLVDQLFNSSEKRLARLLLLLAHYGEGSKREPVVPKLSQETLAEMIGTTRSRVSFFLNRFRKMGLIDYDGGMHVNTALLTVVLRDKF